MRKLRETLSGGLLLLTSAFSMAAKPKLPQMGVQLVAQDDYDLGGILHRVTVYLVLADNSRATAECSRGYSTHGKPDPPCTVEAFSPEKRVTQACWEELSKKSAICIDKEIYLADRNGNDIVLFAANGKVKYHISGSWSDFTFTNPTPGFNPNWTAYCRDGSYSYSKEPSGTCSGHGGVYAWRNP
jgi:hypothetical protein